MHCRRKTSVSAALTTALHHYKGLCYYIKFTVEWQTLMYSQCPVVQCYLIYQGAHRTNDTQKYQRNSSVSSHVSQP